MGRKTQGVKTQQQKYQMCLWLIRFKYLFCKELEYLLLLGMFPSIFRTRLNSCSYVSSALINIHIGTHLGKTHLQIWSSEHIAPQQLTLAWSCAATLCSMSHPTYLTLAHSCNKPLWEAEKGRDAIQSQLDQPHSPRSIWTILFKQTARD